jgi:hypothetical protein
LTINNTLNQLLAKRTPLLLNFSTTVTTASTEFKCAGGETGEGVPIPAGGKAVGLQVWDGTNLRSSTLEVDVAEGDRLNLYAQYGTTDFTVTLRINGVDTTLSAGAVSANAELTASLLIILE